MMKKYFIFIVALLFFVLGACEELDQAGSTFENNGEKIEEKTNEQQNNENELEDDFTEETSSEDHNGTNVKVIDGDLKAHYIDVGQGDATLFEYSHEGSHYRILIDTGDWNSNDVVNYLNTNGITHIDLLVGTHAHADHIGQMDKIIQQYEVNEVWMAGHVTSSSTYERVIDAIATHDVRYYEPRAGDVFDIGPMMIEVVHPNDISGNLNDDSISMRLTYGEISFLFTGDTEATGEQEMLNRGHHLKAHILHLGHHGSSTSTTSSFLSTVSPDVAIYSAGIDNSYGHPHDEIVDRVLNADIDLYGTDIQGTIIISSDGETYSIQTGKDGTLSTSSSSNSESSSNQPSTSAHTNGSSCININEASFEELQNIKHVGVDRAEQIIHLRPFQSVSDLIKVKGIGESRLNDIIQENIACVGG